jgi:spore germination cell wall hydrolase CwlJ-like protein
MVKLFIVLFFFLNSLTSLAAMTYTEEVIAKTLYLEAGNQSTLGKEAVAAVIWNRANGKKEKFIQVCLAKKQFSCWNKKKPNRTKIKSNLDYSICKVIAREMVLGIYRPPHGLELVTHYHEKSVKPNWGCHRFLLMRIEDHFFYKVS